jgi:hypothetical protein
MKPWPTRGIASSRAYRYGATLQRPERGPIDLRQQLVAAHAGPAHDLGIEDGENLADQGAELDDEKKR